MLRKTALVVVAVFASASIASAADILVGPGQSIQAAIVQAVNGDRVLVAPGTYQESIDFLGKNIEVIGVGGSAATILDGAGAAVTLVTFKTNEPPTAVLKGFTIRNAAIGIEFKNAGTATLRRLIVEGQKAHVPLSTGFGILRASSASFPDPRIEECIVRNNENTGIWGKFDVFRCVVSGNQNTGVDRVASMRECLITENTGENGGGVRGFYSAIIDRCVITNNTATKNGGGVYFANEWGGFVANCEIAGNHAALQGGGIYANVVYPLDDSGYSSFDVESCLIHGNTATSAAGLYLSATKSWAGFPSGWITLSRTTIAGNLPDIMTVQSSHKSMKDCIVWNQVGSLGSIATSYCDIQNGSFGDHDIRVNPLFVDAANGDYHLSDVSPCIGQGSPASDRDFEGNVPVAVTDIGGDEFAPHLYIPGLVSSGGPITIHTVGRPGAPVVLFASTALAENGVPTPYGYFALAFPLIPAFPLSLGPIPASSRLSLSTTVPPTVPVGTVICMQAFVGGTNPVLTLPVTLLIN